MCASAQVVGLRSGWQMALVMGGNLLGNHGRRLAQAREVVLDLHAPGQEAFQPQRMSWLHYKIL